MKGFLSFVDNIPFRVVISKIFPFHLLELKPKKELEKKEVEKKFDLYGFFKKDPSRTPFFLFSSLRIQKRTSLHIDFSRVHTLELVNAGDQIMSDLVIRSDCMLKLERLWIRCRGGMIDDPVNNAVIRDKIIGEELFSKKKCFPSLKEFKACYIGNIHLNMNYWYRADHVWSNLENISLEFCDRHLEVNEVITYGRMLDNVKTANFAYLSSKSLQKIILPKVEILKIAYCENLDFEVGSNLGNVEFCGSDGRLFEKLMFIHGVKKVMLENAEEIIEINILRRFFKEKVHCLEDFSLKYFDTNSSNTNTNSIPQDIRTFRLGPSLRKLEIIHCEGIVEEEMFQKSDTPYLKKLVLASSQFKGETVFNNKFNHLNTMHLNGLEVLKEEFLVKNEFPKLRRLVISDCKILGTFEWSGFPSIQVLKFRYLRRFRNQFFSINGSKFPKLEKLLLESCIGITGKQWDSKFTKNIREMRIDNCVNFSCSIFHEFPTPLPCLDNLQLDGLGKIFEEEDFQEKSTSRLLPLFQRRKDIQEEKRYGKKKIEKIRNSRLREKKYVHWIGFSNLVKLSIGFSYSVTDRIFQETIPSTKKYAIFQKLRELEIRYCPRIRGKGWDYLPSLQILRIFGNLENQFEFGKGEETKEQKLPIREGVDITYNFS